MEIDISGRHMPVTPALKSYITEKVKKLDKYALKIESAHVVLAVEKIRQIVEITLNGKNLRLTAKCVNEDMYAAFDLCYGKLQLQLSRQHDRIKDHKTKRGSKAARADKRAS